MEAGRRVWFKYDQADDGEVIGLSLDGVLVRWADGGEGAVSPKLLCWNLPKLEVSAIKQRDAKLKQQQTNFEKRHLTYTIGEAISQQKPRKRTHAANLSHIPSEHPNARDLRFTPKPLVERAVATAQLTDIGWIDDRGTLRPKSYEEHCRYRHLFS